MLLIYSSGVVFMSIAQEWHRLSFFSCFCEIILINITYKSIKMKECCSIDSHRAWEVTNKAAFAKEQTVKQKWQTRPITICKLASIHYIIFKKAIFVKSTAIQDWFSSWMNPVEFQVLWDSASLFFRMVKCVSAQLNFSYGFTFYFSLFLPRKMLSAFKTR